MTTPTPTRRWYHPTPDRFFVGLLAVQVFLLLSERFQWFWFNEKKGWTVLIAIGVVGVAILVMLLWGLVCLVLRRRFQFSVRSLLVFSVVVSVPLGWFAWEMQQARRQQKAAEAIVEAGGIAFYDYQFTAYGRGTQETTPAAWKWLRDLLGQSFWSNVEAVATPPIELHSLTEVSNLVGDLKHLTTLDLSGSRVDDAGMVHLERLARLRKLDLQDSEITDLGLGRLNGLVNLEYLDVRGTKVTDEGVEKLQQALPDCTIAR